MACFGSGVNIKKDSVAWKLCTSECPELRSMTGNKVAQTSFLLDEQPPHFHAASQLLEVRDWWPALSDLAQAWMARSQDNSEDDGQEDVVRTKFLGYPSTSLVYWWSCGRIWGVINMGYPILTGKYSIYIHFYYFNFTYLAWIWEPGTESCWWGTRRCPPAGGMVTSGCPRYIFWSSVTSYREVCCWMGLMMGVWEVRWTLITLWLGNTKAWQVAIP